MRSNGSDCVHVPGVLWFNQHLNNNNKKKTYSSVITWSWLKRNFTLPGGEKCDNNPVYIKTTKLMPIGLKQQTHLPLMGDQQTRFDGKLAGYWFVPLGGRAALWCTPPGGVCSLSGRPGGVHCTCFDFKTCSKVKSVHFYSCVNVTNLNKNVNKDLYSGP